MRTMRWIVTALLVASAVPSPSAFAKATWTKKAQAEDPSVKTCTACHTSMKSKDLNARGQFLMDKKKELKAPEIDFKWLKDYKEPEPKK
jgi:cytochrome c553